MPNRSRHEDARRRLLRWSILTTLLAGIGSGLATAAEAPPAFLHLLSGDRIAGRLVEATQADRIAWQAPGFSEAFEFPVKAVQAVRFEQPETALPIEAEYLIELTGGDILLGSILSIDEQALEFESPGWGRARLDRKFLTRIERRSGSELIFSGLTRLDDWQLSSDNGWTDESGDFVANRPAISIFRDLKMPARARIEIDLSWTKKPSFTLWLGVDHLARSVNPKFQIDVWDNDLVAVCESEQSADVAVLQPLTDGPGSVSLHIYLDQEAGKLLATSRGGIPLADLAMTPPSRPARGGLRLVNRGNDLRLESLRVYTWNAKPPQAVQPSQASIQLTDGTHLEGNLVSYDAAQKTFLVQSGDDERSLPEDQFQSISLGSAPAEAEPAASQVRVQMLGGARISGEMLRIEGDQVHLRCPGLDHPLVLPCSQMHDLVVLSPEAKDSITVGRGGRLEMAGTSLHGSLMEVPRDNSRPGWRPLGAARGARLAPDASARIVYRERPAPAASPAVQQGVNPAVIRNAADQRLLAQLRKRRPAGTSAAPVGEDAECVLHLRSGDTFQCFDVRVDERGVHLKTKISDATFVPHEQVKVLELLPHAAAVQLVKSKKERLLTLPRMQRDSPPTQLIRAANGDYLRARLVAMDARQLQVEIHLEDKTLPRESVARIIWLHADEFDPEAKSPPVAEAPPGIRVQAIPRDGNRLTFYADRFAAATLSGRSEILGNCHVKISDLDELLIGPAIETAASQLAFHQWRLSRAIDPLEFQDNAGAGGSSEGLESVLVGKPAPEISLELLSGEKFRLADRRDRVVVIDFWASWCGPCLQAMPQVDEVVREFAEQHVELVAINLQETPEQIKTALERLQLDITVALDRDGRVAERYGATAIPQTVIIGADGKVSRLFVGGGPRFGEQLREALKSTLTKPAEAAGTQP